jgi:uncharacterized membrane protein
MNLADEIVKALTLSLGSIVEGLAAVVIGAGVLRAIIFYIRTLSSVKHERRDIRLDLGKTLAMALEFLLAADILRTAVAPTWSDIGKLAAIAALRTLLNYFLDRELKGENPHET